MSDDALGQAEQAAIDRALQEAQALFPSFDTAGADDGALSERLVEASLEHLPEATTSAGSGGSGTGMATKVLLAAGVAGIAALALWGWSGPDPTPEAPAPALTTAQPAVQPPEPTQPPPPDRDTPGSTALPAAQVDPEIEADPETATVVTEDPATPAASPAQMLVAADEARREKKNRRARKRYLALIAAYPGSREALIGRVSLGKVDLLRLGKPRRALTQFDAYLKEQPNGNLAEEVTYLRARCFEQLGEDAGERKALEDLLRVFPSATRASRARQRLDELGPG